MGYDAYSANVVLNYDVKDKKVSYKLDYKDSNGYTYSNNRDDVKFDKLEDTLEHELKKFERAMLSRYLTVKKEKKAASEITIKANDSLEDMKKKVQELDAEKQVMQKRIDSLVNELARLKNKDKDKDNSSKKKDYPSTRGSIWVDYADDPFETKAYRDMLDMLLGM